MLGGRAARIPVAQSVQAAAVHTPVDPGPRPRGHPEPDGGREPHRGTRLCRRLGHRRPGAGCAHQLAPRAHQPHAGRESRYPAYGRGARDRGALLRGPGRVWRLHSPAPHDAVRICGGRHGHPVSLRKPARRGGGRPLLRRRGERHRRGTRAQRRHRHRARRPRLRAVAAFLPRPPHRRRHRDGAGAHQQLHRRQRGAVPLSSPVAAPSPGGLARGAGALAHRGPDGERIVGHERARLGARRLAIMDLTTGDQPFQNPDGAIWMICNGEIYNAPELRREYTLAGYPFRSTGDIETIVPLYERFGADGVARLEGMFGLAVWDDRQGRLVLARDRAGEKPLFWAQVDGELRFASEMQALLAYPDQPRRVNPIAAALYGALGYVPAPHTMLDGISKLAPAHLLVADRKGLAVRRYWDPAAVAARPSRLDGPATLRDALLRAVERELMSDVPVGVFTSGGLDSSLLAAAAARVMSGEKIHTYSVKFFERGYDESPHAEAVTHDIRTIHHVVTADDSALERAFDVVTRSLAEPVGDPAILPTFLLAESAREHVKVVLSGEGADELFGGYPTS